MTKATEIMAKTAKQLNKLEHKHKDAVVKKEQAEKKVEVRLFYSRMFTTTPR